MNSLTEETVALLPKQTASGSGVGYLECGDLSPLCIRVGSQGTRGCDRSQPTKAVTGHRTPKVETKLLKDSNPH